MLNRIFVVVVAPSRKYVWSNLFMKSDQLSRSRDPAFPVKEAFGISKEENRRKT